ncbi:MAG TPA: MMPL family transporter [Marmoricola sp.]|nr:MMPL family transporter [Marmoricola sp.]HNO39524.1 MMPL family transporter [Marmoricola sp.]
MPNILVSRRGARITLVLAVLIMGTLMAVLGSAVAPPRGDNLPPNSDSARVQQALQKFPDANRSTVILVASGSGPLSEAQLDDFNQLGQDLSSQASPAIPANDHQAAIISLPMPHSSGTAQTTSQIQDLRDRIADHDLGGLRVQVTGGPAFGADIASAFDGADLKLLLTTIAVVALLLLLTYRSPILWLVPLVVVAMADQVAAVVTRELAAAYSLHFDAGIVSVLVFGAGTNYAMLLISRYREELAVQQDHRLALASAWRGSLPAILASNLTIVLALSTLLLAALPQTRDLGIASAVGLLVVLLTTLTALPAALASCGPRIFWPFQPQPGDQSDPTKGLWGRIGRQVVRRPVSILSVGAILLGTLAASLATAQVGLSQAETFRAPSESAVGLSTLTRHFPAGLAEPIDVLAATNLDHQVRTTLNGTQGIARADIQASHGGVTHWRVISTAAPGTNSAVRTVESLRSNLASVDQQILVGGPMAQEVDIKQSARADFWLIAPLVLLVSLIMLVLLLRSILVPLALLLVNALGAAAAIGLGTLLSEAVLHTTALDSQLPLLAFLFLVALGIDYTMFLSHRISAESRTHGAREGIVRGLASTGTVITSAGVVLAGVFAALATLPLMILGQLGIIVGVGVLLDTLLVRTLVVPAVFTVFSGTIRRPTAPDSEVIPPTPKVDALV